MRGGENVCPWPDPKGGGKSRGTRASLELGRASTVTAMKAVVRISAMLVRRCDIVLREWEGVEALCLVAFSCTYVEELCLVS